MKMRSLSAICLILLTSCGQAPTQTSTEKSTVSDVAESPASGATGAAPLTVAVPQMAYVYHYGFTLPGDALAKVQARHVAMCDALGPARCQVLAM